MAWRSRSTDKDSQRRYLPNHSFTHHGGGRLFSSLEHTRVYPGDVICSERRASGASSYYLGGTRGMHVGGGQHHDHLCHPGRWPEHRVSSMEYKQFAGDPLGICFVQRTAPGRMEALAGCAGRSDSYVRRRNLAGFCIFHSSSSGQSHSRCNRGSRRGDLMGNDVYPLPKSLSNGHESPLFHNILYRRRVSHNDRPGPEL